MSRELERRDLLKATGALAVGAGGVGGVPVASAHGDDDHGSRYPRGPGVVEVDRDGPLEVTVFVTQQLYDYSRDQGEDGYHAAEVTKAYLEGAFDQTNQFDVDVTIAEVTPLGPGKDDPMISGDDDPPVTAPCPCHTGRICDYGSKVDWFRDWYWKGWEGHPTTDHCGQYHARSVDANLIIGRGRGGGVSFGNPARACFSQAGDRLLMADASYQQFGYDHDGDDPQYRAIRATIHEVGHTLMDGGSISDEDGDDDPWGGEHDMSEIIHDEDTGHYAITPMGLYGDQNNEGTNEHDKSLTDVSDHDDGGDCEGDGPNNDRHGPPNGDCDGEDFEGKPDGFAYFYSEATLEHFYLKPPYDIVWAAGSGGGGFAGSLDTPEMATHTYTLRSDPASVTFSLEGPTNADFDLYLTFDGSTPSRTNHDASARSTSSNEEFAVSGSDVGDEIGVAVEAARGSGEYTVTVTEESAQGPPPTPSFDVGATAVGEPVTFDATASEAPEGSIQSYEWALGDGTTAQGAVVEHTYTDDGEYPVTLTVTDDDDLSASETRSVVVGDPGATPVARVDGPSETPVGNAARYDASGSTDPDGDIAAYSWSFDDGAAADGPVVTHAFGVPGDHTVEVTVVDERGNSNTATHTVSVEGRNKSPVARIDAPDEVGIGDSVTLDGSGSKDPDGGGLFGDGLEYEWALGDRSDATGKRATHSYDDAGTYEVTLTVTDEDGATDTARHTLDVLDDNRAPTARIDAPDEIGIGESVTFDGSGSSDPDGGGFWSDGLEYEWELSVPGGLVEANGKRVTRSYDAAGTYEVELTVTDSDGATDTARHVISVVDTNEAPTARIDAPDEVGVGESVTFDGSGSSDPDGGGLWSDGLEYEWDLGDWTGDTGRRVRHSYDDADTYEVELTVTDEDGATDTAVHRISVEEPADDENGGDGGDWWPFW